MQDKRKVSERRVALLSGVLTAGLFAGAALLLALFGENGREYGIALFLVLPVATGFAAAMAVKPVGTLIVGAVLVAAITLSSMMVFGHVGIVCGLMSLPIVLPGIVLGALFGYLLRRFYDTRLTRAAGFLLAAAALTGTAGIEAAHKGETGGESVVSSIRLRGSARQVWPFVCVLDQIHVSKPFLLRIGLPVPLRCTLEREQVGAIRTCHFDQGWAEEKVKAIQPQRLLELDVRKAKLPGEAWLSFKEAVYTLRDEGDDVIVTRTTTYCSTLQPRWYWRLPERAAIAAEHRYILDELAWRMARAKSD